MQLVRALALAILAAVVGATAIIAPSAPSHASSTVAPIVQAMAEGIFASGNVSFSNSTAMGALNAYRTGNVYVGAIGECHIDARLVSALYYVTVVKGYGVDVSDSNRWCVGSTTGSSQSYHKVHGGGGALDIGKFLAPGTSTWVNLNGSRDYTATEMQFVKDFLYGTGAFGLPVEDRISWQIEHKKCRYGTTPNSFSSTGNSNYFANLGFYEFDATDCHHYHFSYSAPNRTYPTSTATLVAAESVVPAHLVDGQIVFTGGVVIPNNLPIGNTLSAVQSGDEFVVSGYAYDPDASTTALSVRVTHDWTLNGESMSEVSTGTSNVNTPFEVFLPITSGEMHTFTIEALDLGGLPWNTLDTLSMTLGPNFNSSTKLTRGEVAEYLYRYSDDPLVLGEEFEGHQNQAALNWMLEEQIASTFTGAYSPENLASRQALAVFLYRMSDVTFTGPVEPTFSDIPTSHSFYNEIEWLAAEGITAGQTDGTFGGSSPVTKGEAVSMLHRLAVGPLTDPDPYPDPQPMAGPDSDPYPVARTYWDIRSNKPLALAAEWADRQFITAEPFSDVPASSPYSTEVRWLKQSGISDGYQDGTYGSTEAVTRHALSVMMYRLAGSPEFTPPAVSPFSDVPTTHPNYKEIAWMASEGISTGYTDGTFRPVDPVTRQAVAAFLYRLADEPAFSPPAVQTFTDLGTTHGFYSYVEWVSFAEISDGYVDGTYRPSITLERGPLAALLYRFAQYEAS